MMLQQSNWQQIFRQNFRCIEKLVEFLQLSKEQKERVLSSPRFSLNLPLRLAQKIEKGTLDDPLFRQFVPLAEEKIPLKGFSSDPLGEALCRQESKLLHKYKGRALLVCTSTCAMHCRYCFRQEFSYDIEDKTFARELAYIAAHEDIEEVILSGGDPLSLPNRSLSHLIKQLAAIPHLQRLRFHTRFPIGIPERIDEEFLALCESSPLPIWFVVHCNHFSELDDAVLGRLKQLQRRGVTILNQTVLLRGVNDSYEALKKLFETLANKGVFPYYLHQLDRFSGMGHFEVPIEEGKALIQKLANSLSGYAVPRYVKEVPGEPGKVWL